MNRFLKGLEELRQVDWARSWHWDIQFPNAPEPFSKWFPASAIEENLAAVSEYSFEGSYSSYDVPQKSSAFTLNVTFYDSSMLVLHNWFTDWINVRILGNGNYIACLENAVEPVNIVKLAPNDTLISLKKYLVFPTGSLNYPGSSSPEIISNSIEFKVAGTP